jgi:YidC/Oxa1 family membrane protein insertase
MNREDDNRRLLLAAALCLGVLGLWGLANDPGPTAPPNGAAEDAAAVTETQTGTAAVAKAAAPEPMESDASAAGEASMPDEEALPAVEPEQHTVAGVVESGGDRIPFEMSFTNLGGGLETFVLPSYRERDAKNRPLEQPIQLADPVMEMPAKERRERQMGGIAFGSDTSFTVPAGAAFEVVDQTEAGVRYRLRLPDGVVVEREWSVDRTTALVEGAVTIRNESEVAHRYQLDLVTALEKSPALEKKDDGWFPNIYPPADHLKGLCWSDGSVQRADWKELEEEPEQYDTNVQWVAVDRQYFVSSLILRDRGEAGCRLEAEGDVVRAVAQLGSRSIEPSEEQRHKFSMYLGVKKPALLTVADAQLESAIDYTVLGLDLAPLCAFLIWILGWFHEATGSWGLAIIGLTVLVKLVLFPLNQRQGKSMRAMAALKPQMDAIREKFAEDRQRQNEEMIKLYRTNNVNPAGGCLPLLLQMPIMFALYRSLWVSTDIYQQSFLWMSDLTVRDPFWVLPLSLMAVMFIQQRMTPTTMDPAQQKVMQYALPVMFGVMLSGLPAGLCLYILVNTLLTIVQQHFINRSIGAPPSAPAAPAAPSQQS